MEREGPDASVLRLELEQLDDIAGWIFEQNGPASTTLTDVPAEPGIGNAQTGDQGIQLAGDNHESIPPTGLRSASSLTTTSCTGSAEIKGQVVALERGELAWGVHLDPEIEIAALKPDRSVYVGNDIADGCHVPLLLLQCVHIRRRYL
jgi:hypothetical protein